MKKLSIALIVIGICLLAFPSMEKAYSRYQEDRLMEQYETALASAHSRDGRELDSARNTSDTGESAEENNTQIDFQSHPEAIAIIRLPKIEINLPVLYGATQNNLRYAAAQMEGTTPIGEIGNTAIAAHSNYTDERFFTNLHQLSRGDEIIIETLEASYTYTVTEKKVVQPTDFSVLSPQGDKKLLTLITCQHQADDKLRLIVQGEMVD